MMLAKNGLKMFRSSSPKKNKTQTLVAESKKQEAKAKEEAAAKATEGSSNSLQATKPSSSTVAEDLPPKVRSCRVFLVYNDSEEFLLERRAFVMEIWPELQMHAFQLGVQLELIDPLPEKGRLSIEVAETLADEFGANNNDWLIMFLGDRYGSPGAPTEIRKGEFDSLRQTIFEQNADVKLFDQYYYLDRTRELEEYRIKSGPIDPKTRLKLTKLIQKAASQAFEEGTINQVHQQRQERFFYSPLEIVAQKAIEVAGRSGFVMRNIAGAKPDLTQNAPFIEKNDDGKNKIATLKTKITAAFSKSSIFAHSLSASDDGDIIALLNSREFEKYKDQLSRQLTEHIKTRVIKEMSATAEKGPPTVMEIAKSENEMHLAQFSARQSKAWLSTAPRDKLITDLLAIPGTGAGGVYILQGADMSCKTQILCRLYEKAPHDAIKIIRFVGLTHSSWFAHELWYWLGLTLCQATGIDSSEFQVNIKYSTSIDLLEKALQTISKPVYLFLDDIHSMKFGHFLSDLTKKVAKGLTKLFIYMTTSNVAPFSIPYIVTQTTNIESPNENEIIDILKLDLIETKRSVSSEQFSMIKIQLTASNCNLAVGKALLNDLLLNGCTDFNGGIEGRLGRIEELVDKFVCQHVCRMLAVSLHGISRLEMFDALTALPNLLEDYTGETVISSIALYDVLKQLGNLVSLVYLDHQLVYKISHPYVMGIFRHRFLNSNVKLKETHNLLSELFGDVVSELGRPSPRGSLTFTPFPQGTKRDNGVANLRRIRNLWYHLLHTGNMDSLKVFTLCSYEFVDCVLRNCGLAHLMTIYEECAMQVLHHDIQVLCEQLWMPAIKTIVRDPEQMAAEVIGRLRFTRGENSHFLNTMVEQAMAFVDTFNHGPLLVPLTCWIQPPIMKCCRKFQMKDWRPGQTILAPTQNHQHVLISGNLEAPGLIYMYHVPSQLVVCTFKGHMDTVTSLSVSNNGLFFVSTSADKTIRLWSFQTGENYETFSLHSQRVNCAILNSADTWLVTGSSDSSAKVIELETGNIIKTFPSHMGSVVSLQLTSNDEFLVAGSGDFNVVMYDLKRDHVMCRMSGLMAPVSCIAITSNDAFVVVACEDETLRVFGTVSGHELLELMGHEGKVNSLAAAQDDCQLFAATKGKIYCYDVHNGTILDVLTCDQNYPVSTLKITSDNFFLISGCGSMVHVWNIHKRIHDVHEAVVEKTDGFVTAITMGQCEKMSACGTCNGVVAIWDNDICQCVTTCVQSKSVSITCLQFTEKSAQLLSGNAQGNIILIEVPSGIIIREVNFHSLEIVSISIVEHGMVYSVCKEAKLCAWPVFEDDENIETITQGIVPPIFTPPHGKILIAHCPNNPKEMKVWAQSEVTFVQKNKLYHSEEITCFAACKQGALVATGSTDKSVKLWQHESGYLTQVLVGHEDTITSIVMAEDERLVVSGAKDGKMIIWNVATGDICHTISTCSPLSTVSLTMDATVAFCGMDSGWFDAYSTETGKILSTFNAHRPVKNAVVQSTASRIIVHLSGCAQLPILCLHNTPACQVDPAELRRRSTRAQSVSSTGLPADAPGPSSENRREATSNAQSGSNGHVRVVAAPRPTFDKLERSKSRSSLIEKDRTTTLTTTALIPTQKSGLCILL